MKTKTVQAYAKINLFLEIIGKRTDGYHDLVSVMQTISLHDDVTCKLTDGSGITLTCSDPAIPTDGRNIAVQCAERFFRAFPEARRGGIHLDLVKRIPTQAGLGGGSSDGATVLRLLNELSGVRADVETLCEIGAEVGADVPFCVKGGVCICEGTGARLIPLTIPDPSYSVLVAFSSASRVSTGEAYRLLDDSATDRSANESPDYLLEELTRGLLPTHLFNRFENAILPRLPDAARLRDTISGLGAISVLMSGSGSAIYGIFPDEVYCQKANQILKKEGIWAFTCRPIPSFDQHI